MKYIISFSDDSPELSSVGGKGINLIKLYKHGFNVPEGFILTTEVYDLFVETHGLQTIIDDALSRLDSASIEELEHMSRYIRANFHSKPLPGKLKALILEMYHDLNLSNVAVRSSATAEDLPGFSFAGQQDTFLNILDIDHLYDAIIHCLSSLWTARAIQYRLKNDISNQNISLAVIIQQMVDSTSSGVMFSANPLTNNYYEIVIEAIYGLGEALVSGQVEPDTYIVDQNTNERSISLGDKSKRIISTSEGGTTMIEDNNKEQVLTPNQLDELVKIAIDLRRIYEIPQDIEWAYDKNELFILQSRPITTLFPISDEILNHKPKVLLSVNIVQGVMQPFTPLGQDILTIFLLSIGKSFNITTSFDTQQSIYSTGHRLYLNILPVLSHPLGAKLFPKFLQIAEPETARIISELSQKEKIKTKHQLDLSSLQKVFRNYLFVLNQVRSQLKHPEQTRHNFISRVDNLIGLMRTKEDQLDDIKLRIDFIEKAMDQICRLIFLDGAPVIFGSYAALFLSQVIAPSSVSKSKFMDLTKGMPHNVTTQMNLKLWEMVKLFRKDEVILEYLQSHSVEEITNQYHTENLPSLAQQQIDTFIRRYGFRGFIEIDVGRKRWKDDCRIIISNIKQYLEIEETDLFPDVRFRQGKIAAQQAFDEIFAVTQTAIAGNLRSSMLNYLIKRNRQLGGMREYPKFAIVKAFEILRNNLLAIGRILVEDGWIDHDEDIFYLSYNDLREYKSSSVKFREIIQHHRRTFQREKNRKRIPRVILNSGQVFYYAESDTFAQKGQLRGNGVSSGIIEGKVRIMYHPGDRLDTNEIIVCPATDPSWTPLFQSASGIILEVGGMMTHGAVVAREHGIPGIVGVKDATTRLKTGQVVRMDGSNGKITIL